MLAIISTLIVLLVPAVPTKTPTDAPQGIVEVCKAEYSPVDFVRVRNCYDYIPAFDAPLCTTDDYVPKLVITSCRPGRP